MKTADQLLFTVSYDEEDSFPFHDSFFSDGHGVRRNIAGETTFLWQVRDGRLMYRVEEASPQWTPESRVAQAAYERYLASLIVDPA